MTITGSGLESVTEVKFGAEPAASFIVDSDTQVTAVSPPHERGQVHVTLGNAAAVPPSPAAPTATFSFEDGTWSAGDPTGTPRSSHTTTLLRSGKVLVVGGEGPSSPGKESGEPLNTAEVYDPATRRWASVASMAVPRAGHTATLLPDDTILVAGGRTAASGNVTDSVEVYDAAKNEWRPLVGCEGSPEPGPGCTLTTPRSGHSATLLKDGQRVLVAGGERGESSAEIYTPALGVSISDASVTEGAPSAVATFTVELSEKASSPVSVRYESTPETAAQRPIVSPLHGDTLAESTCPPPPWPRLPPSGSALVDGVADRPAPYDCKYDYLAASGTLVFPPGTTSLEVGVGIFDDSHNEECETFGVTLFDSANAVLVRARGQAFISDDDGGAPCSAPTQTTSATAEDAPPARWVATGSMANRRASHTATLLDGSHCDAPLPGYPCGSVLVVGGRDETEAVPEVYDPERGLWRSAGDPLVPRFSGTATLLDGPPCRGSGTRPSYCGQVLLAGGKNGSSVGASLAVTEVYDPSTNTWAPAPPMGTRRTGHTATLLDGPPCRAQSPPVYCGKVLVAGGEERVFGACASEACGAPRSELFDPWNGQAGAWTFTAAMIEAWSGHTASAFNDGSVIVVGRGSFCARCSRRPVEIFHPARFSTPSVTGLSPEGGSVAGGTKVVVTGAHFESVREVKFGAAPAAHYRVESTTRIIAISPPGAAVGPVAVTVVTSPPRLPPGAPARASAPLSIAEFSYTEASGRWADADHHLSARGFHTVTRIAGGEVLAVGGCCKKTSFDGYGNTALAEAERYRPGSDLWSSSNDGGAPPVSMHTATLLGGGGCGQQCGKVLVAGGFSTHEQESASDGAWLYDPASRRWDKTEQSLPSLRAAHTATLLEDGRVVVVGGAVCHGRQCDVVGSTAVYHPGTGDQGEWSTTGSLATARRDHTATLLPGNLVLVAGGRDRDGRPLASAELYDPAANGGAGAWSTVPSDLHTARFGHTASPVDCGADCVAVVVAGGVGSDGPVAGAERYSQGTWSSAGTLASPRARHTATVIEGGGCHTRCGHVLVAGGHNDRRRAMVAVELYDPITNRWSPAPPLATARVHHAATALDDGRVLVSGGLGDDQGPIASAEIFSPTPAPGPPSIIDVDPPVGPSSGGTSVLLTGTNLSVVDGVRFGERGAQVAARFGDTAILVVAPAHPRGSVQLRVNTEGSELVTGEFTYASGTWRPTGRVVSGPAVECLPQDPLTGKGLSRAPEWCAARMMHTATALEPSICQGPEPPSDYPCGKILVAGGADTIAVNHQTRSSAALYDPDSGRWRATGALAEGRREHTATLLDGPACRGPAPPSYCGRVLVVGGASGQRLAELFDPVSGTWTPTGPPVPEGDHPGAIGTSRIPLQRFSHTATLLDGLACQTPSPPPYCGKVLVVGGASNPADRTPIGKVELYDPATGAWTPGPDLPGRAGHSATLLPRSSEVVVIGGFTRASGAVTAIRSVQIYNPAEGTFGGWRSGGALDVERFSHTATVLDGPACRAESPPLHCGKILVAGGFSNSNRSISSVEVYDPNGDPGGSVSPARSLRTARAAHTATLLPDGQVLVAGAAFPFDVLGGEQQPLASAEIYDPMGGRWAPTESMATARGLHTATVLDGGACRRSNPPPYCGTVLVVGGGTERLFPIPLDSAEIYNPAPSVTAVSPTRVSDMGGTPLTVTGTGFTRASTVQVGTAAVAAAAVDVVSSTQLRFPAPAHSPGPATVAVINAGGTSATTAGDPAAEVVYVGPPGPITELTADVESPTSVALNFTAPHDGSTLRPATSYRFTFARAGGPPEEARCVPHPCTVPEAKTVGFTVGNLTPASSYTFTVAALNEFGVAGPQASVETSTGGEPGPAGVGDLVATAESSSRIVLAFSAPGAYGGLGSPVTRYVVKQSTAPITGAESFDAATTLCDGECRLGATQVGEALSLAVTGLRAGTTYHYALRPLGDDGTSGPISNSAHATTFGNAGTVPCPPTTPAGPGQVQYGGGRYWLVGVPSGTVVPSDSPLYGWVNQGAGGRYSLRSPATAVAGGEGYWSWSRCDRLVALGRGADHVRLPLGAYRASMVGNPSGVGPARLSGHDFAARWDPMLNRGAGGYVLSDYRQAQSLAVGEGAWVFAYNDTVADVSR